MIHNAQNMRVRQEVTKIKQMFASDQHFRTRIERGDHELFTALQSGNDQNIEKLIGERMKA